MILLPHADAFDVMVQLAQAVPDGMNHDIEELDVQRGHVSIHGIVPSIPDAQQIATTLKAVRCFQDVKIVKNEPRARGAIAKNTPWNSTSSARPRAKKKRGAPSASASAGVSGGAKVTATIYSSPCASGSTGARERRLMTVLGAVLAVFLLLMVPLGTLLVLEFAS